MNGVGITDVSVAPGSLGVAIPFAANLATKTAVFTGAANLGAVGVVPLFTVTGAVFVYVMAVCTESLDEAAPTATISVGITGATAALIALLNAVDIDVDEIWLDVGPAQLETIASTTGSFIAGGADIFATVAAQAVDDGTLIFNCYWTPVTAGASVVPA